MDEIVSFKCACADCGEIISYTAAEAGKIIECPKCKEKSQLPPPPKPGNPAFTDSSFDPDAKPPKACPLCGNRLGNSEAACSVCEEQQRLKKRRKVLWISASASAAVLVVAVIVPAIWRRAVRPRPAAALPASVPSSHPVEKTVKSLDNLQPGRFYVKRERNAVEAVASGDIQNASEHIHRDIKVHLDLFDARGEKIGTATDFIAALPPHETWRVIVRIGDSNVMTARFNSFTHGL